MEKYLDFSDEQIDNLLFNIKPKEEEKNKKDICNNCESTNLHNDNNKLLCNDCGNIIREYLNSNAQFETEHGSSSYGCPNSYFYPNAALGCKIKSKRYSKIANLQKQGQMPYKEKSLMDVINDIQTRCNKYKITQKIIDTANVLYKKISDCKHTKGERKGKSIIMRCINRRSLIAACVFYACKLENLPRNPQEIGEIFDLEVKHVNKGCRKFLDYVNITDYYNKIKSCQASNFISRYSQELNLSQEILEMAQQISENIHKLDIASNHEPPSIAAGSVLLICNHLKKDISKNKISEIFRISDVTISKTYRKIQPYHKIIMDNEITDYIAKSISNHVRNEAPLNLNNIIEPSEKLTKKTPIKAKKEKKKKQSTRVDL